MNGICYWSTVRDSSTFEKRAENRLIPLLGIPLQISSAASAGVYNYGMGEAGFSMHMFADGAQPQLLLGAPGIFNWKGTPLLTDYTDRRTLPKIGYERLIRSGDYFGETAVAPPSRRRVFHRSLFHEERSIRMIRTIFLFLGYSVTSGNYVRPRDRWYAAGAPRGANLMGRVLIFRYSELADRRLNVIRILDGEQYGEYFGASLASCDVNNDGRDELLVGAPLFTRVMDEGRVYAYFVKSNVSWSRQRLSLLLLCAQ